MRLNNISKSFEKKHLFKDFSLEIPAGSLVYVTGPSGCGKTTLLNIIAGLEKADSGSCEGFGKISYLFQEPRLLMWKTVFENIALVSDSENALKCIEMVGLEKEKNSYPNELSGGQRQRVAIARALAFRSDTILMDEPFQNLDEKLHYRLISDFISLYLKEKRTVIWVSHDSEEEALIRDRVHDYIKVSL